MAGCVTQRRRPRWSLATIAIAVALAAAACGSDSPPKASPPASATAESGSSAATDSSAAEPCVADVDKVTATQPTAAMTTAELPADLVAKLDKAAQDAFPLAAAPGAIVGVRTPQGTFTKAYGEADPIKHVPMAVDMHTRIGSVTKTFTGTLILQLEQQGKLSLDDKIDKYFPGVPNGSTITLRQLANMTSGIASYTRSAKFTDVFFEKPETIFKHDDLIAIGLAESPLFPPGEKFDYSNTNTMLLGKVVEKVTGGSFEAALQSQILDPLKMANTSWPGESTDIPTPHPQGYSLQGNAATRDNPSDATNWNPSWGGAAGEMISNMADLLVYGRALGTGQGLLDAKTQAERLKSVPGPAGYGIAMGCAGGWVGHTGELPGFNTSVFYDTTSDTTVIVQVNSDIASGNCEQSPTLIDDPGAAVCRAPATRMFVELSTALGHTFTPPPLK
jgi:D-alanyl-D-alanine carboxypeptidase